MIAEKATLPVVYFVQHPEDGYIKIGYTINLQWRLAALQLEYGVKLKLLGVVDGGREEERHLHNLFRPDRRFGEWHRPSDCLLDYISQNARQIEVTPTPKPQLGSSEREARIPVGVPVYRIWGGEKYRGYHDNFVRHRLIERFGSFKKVNQSQVCRESGIPMHIVGPWVRGRREFATLSVIQKWADYFGVEAEDIISFANQHPQPTGTD